MYRVLRLIAVLALAGLFASDAQARILGRRGGGGCNISSGSSGNSGCNISVDPPNAAELSDVVRQVSASPAVAPRAGAVAARQQTFETEVAPVRQTATRLIPNHRKEARRLDRRAAIAFCAASSSERPVVVNPPDKRDGNQERTGSLASLR